MVSGGRLIGSDKRTGVGGGGVATGEGGGRAKLCSLGLVKIRTAPRDWPETAACFLSTSCRRTAVELFCAPPPSSLAILASATTRSSRPTGSCSIARAAHFHERVLPVQTPQTKLCKLGRSRSLRRCACHQERHHMAVRGRGGGRPGRGEGGSSENNEGARTWCERTSPIRPCSPSRAPPPQKKNLRARREQDRRGTEGRRPLRSSTSGIPRGIPRRAGGDTTRGRARRVNVRIRYSSAAS